MPASLCQQFTPAPYLLINRIQHYAWGTRGAEAFIPRLLGIEAQDGLPYAELWMGTHPSAPSMAWVEGTPLPLHELVARWPEEVLGPQVAARFGGLPFLFKVLSAAEPLSIQVHPNREQARWLHARDPDHYPDDNHKPEIAIALDELTALVGFKPVDGLLQTLAAYPELMVLIGDEVTGALQAGALDMPAEGVRRLYLALWNRMRTEPETLAQVMAAIAARLQADGVTGEEADLFLDLYRRYGGSDIGVPTALLLNRVRLEKGQGLYIAAGVPHAYLWGNIVECMATSDNVVRAGLTPKFKDLEALADVLIYEAGRPALITPPPEASEFSYPTPAAEFEVRRLLLGAGERRSIVRNGRPQILLLIAGAAELCWSGGTMAWQQGGAVLVPAFLASLDIIARCACEVYAATVPG